MERPWAIRPMTADSSYNGGVSFAPAPSRTHLTEEVTCGQALGFHQLQLSERLSRRLRTYKANGVGRLVWRLSALWINNKLSGKSDQESKLEDLRAGLVRRRDQPSRPSATTCSCCAFSKTLPMPTEANCQGRS